jgi:hypothetical protein
MELTFLPLFEGTMTEGERGGGRKDLHDSVVSSRLEINRLQTGIFRKF